MSQILRYETGSVFPKILMTDTLHLDRLERTGGGEGFFPPFLRLDDALLFSPHAVKRMMPERNLLYSLLKTDQKKFDNIVSDYLEPALLADAAECLSLLPSVEIKANVDWERGEIDLLVLHAKSKSALQIQAKAAVPPEGARMIAQIESRTMEAVKQIRRFMDLEENQKDAVCSRAFGTDLTGLSWTSGVLVRTCLGTEKSWESISGCIPLNPIILRSSVKKMLEMDSFALSDIASVAWDALENLRRSAVGDWEQKSFSLFGENIVLPLLDLNYAAIGEFRDNANE